MSDQTERAAFEAWVDQYNAAHTHWQFSMSSPISDHCWAAWQARAAQPAAEPVATMYRGGSDKFGRANVLQRWEDGALSLPNGEYKLYSHPAPAAEPLSDALDAKRLDWIECNVMNGKLEIAQSIFKTGYEFGFWQQNGPRAIVKTGTLRAAIDAAIAAHEAKR